MTIDNNQNEVQTQDGIVKVKRTRQKRTNLTEVSDVSYETSGEGRRERVPMGGLKQKLRVMNKDPNYHYHWFNDYGSKLFDAEQAGYEYVTTDSQPGISQGIGKKVSYRVGSSADGQPMSAYLMRIKREWYEQDQQAKAKNIDAVDAQIHRGKYQEEGDDNRYVPSMGISISRPKIST